MPKSYTIQSTNNYSAFGTIDGNRSIRPAHVKRLKEAISVDPTSIMYNPILTNEKLEVIDGQHRLQAIEELELPVYYITVPNLGIKEVQKLNSVAKQWQPVDYAQAFSRLGNKNYDYYLMFKGHKGKYRDLSLNHDSLMRYLALDNPITSAAFNEGKLRVDDFDRSLELLTQLREVGDLYPRYGIRSFALAFLRVASHPDYKHSRMMDRLQSDAMHKYMRDFSKERDYAKALNQIYNWNMKKRVTLVDASYLINE